MNLNWKAWLKGLIAALATAVVTVIGVLLGLDTFPTGFQLFKIVILPAALGFFTYIQQTPPPMVKG
jgi:zinc transporter ZupT